MVNEKELSKINNLLKIAEADLYSSKILFKSKKYPNAVLCLQQSVEKTMKTHSLINELVPFDKLKDKIGHNPLKLYAKTANENLSKSKNLTKVFQIKPELKNTPIFKNLKLKEFETGNKRVINIISQVNEQKKIFSDDKYELKEAIKEMKELIKKNSKSNKIKLDDDSIKEMKQNWIESARPLIQLEKEQISENWEEEINSLPRETIEKIVRNISSLFILGGVSHTLNFMLNLLLKPHFELARYPEAKNPLEYYTRKNPLIKDFNRLLHIQKSNLKFHENYLEFIKNMENKEHTNI